jgi:hypothetical protein
VGVDTDDWRMVGDEMVRLEVIEDALLYFRPWTEPVCGRARR